MQPLPIIISDESITAVVLGKTWTVKKGDPNFASVKKAVDESRWEDVPKLISREISINEWAQGLFRVKDHHIYHKDERLPEKLSERILKHIKAGESPTPLLRFWERLDQNPSYRSVQQLWDFLSHSGIPIEPDGTFLAYKAVKGNWTDYYTGKVDNSVGTINEMPRNRVSDDPKVACHYGYHVGALGYAQSFKKKDGRLVICRVDPKDVVGVPYDSNQEKMRVCKYEVIGLFGAQLPDTTFVEDGISDFPNDCIENAEEAPVNEDRRAELAGLTLSLLREYANKELGITSVKKIIGGKSALIDRILAVEARRKPSNVAMAPANPSPHKNGEENTITNSLDNLNEDELLQCTIGVLRQYARKHLRIVGANKIPGGKSALVKAILGARK